MSRAPSELKISEFAQNSEFVFSIHNRLLSELRILSFLGKRAKLIKLEGKYEFRGRSEEVIMYFLLTSSV